MSHSLLIKRVTLSAGNRLEICADAGTSGFFLFDHRNDGATFDTWHKTLEDALHQAGFAYHVKPEEWTDINEPS